MESVLPFLCIGLLIPDLWDQPQVEDIGQFPSEEITIKTLRFNRQHHCWLENMQSWEGSANWSYWEDLKNENEQYRCCWQNLVWAWQFKDNRIDELKSLRSKLGSIDYLDRRMPPPVPWRGFWMK